MKSAATIAFDYRPSGWIAGATALVCTGAVIASWLSALPLGASVALSLAVIALGTRVLRRLCKPPFRRIAYRASGWLLLDVSSEEHEAILESHAHLGVLLALRFRHGPRARFHALLAPDNLDAESRRRLVLLLSRAEIVQAP